MAEYGREGCVELSSHCAQSLHICPKGNAQTSYMGGNTVSETFMHMFLFGIGGEVSKTGPRQSIWSVMAEYEREGCVTQDQSPLHHHS